VQGWSEQSVLITAQLQQEPASFPQDASGGSDDLANNGQTISATVEGSARLVLRHVARKKPKTSSRHIRGDGGDEVHASRAERVAEMTEDGRDAVLVGACHCSLVVVDTQHRSLRVLRHKGTGHGAASCAEVGGAPDAEEPGCLVDELLCLPARDVNAPVDRQTPATELDLAGYPRQRLTLLPSGEHVLQFLAVADASKKFVRLLLRSHASSRRQPLDHPGPGAGIYDHGTSVPVRWGAS